MSFLAELEMEVDKIGCETPVAKCWHCDEWFVKKGSREEKSLRTVPDA